MKPQTQPFLPLLTKQRLPPILSHIFRDCKSQKRAFWDNVRNTTRHWVCSLGCSPRQPLPPLHGGVLSLPALDVTSPAASAALDVLVKVTVASSPCFRTLPSPGDAGRGWDGHNIGKAQPKQAQGL